jgi:hypothetical protein
VLDRLITNCAVGLGVSGEKGRRKKRERRGGGAEKGERKDWKGDGTREPRNACLEPPSATPESPSSPQTYKEGEGWGHSHVKIGER